MFGKRENKKLLKLSSAFLTVMIMLTTGCSKDKPTPPESAQNEERQSQQVSAKTKPARPVQEVIRSDRLNVTLLVNDTRYIVLPSDVPIYIQCIIENPLGQPVSLAASMTPAVAKADGDVLNSTWQMLRGAGEKIAAGKFAVMAWQLTSPLEPGDYRISLAGESVPHGSNQKAKITPARLTITADKADEKTRAYYRRRLLALEGKNDKVLAELDNAIAAAPDDLSLQRQRVDALESAGRYEDALDQLRAMGMAIQKKSKDPAHPVPDWVVFRDLRLQEIIRANIKKAEADNERK